MEKIFVAQRVVNKLIETETAVDVAFTEAAELMSELLKSRKDVDAPLSFADDAQVKLTDAMRSLSEARTSMVAVHRQLAEAKLRLGIRTKLNNEDTPPHAFTTIESEIRKVG